MNVFRYKMAVSYFIIGIVIAIVSFTDGVWLINNAYTLEKETEKFTYKSSLNISVSFDEENDIASIADIVSQLNSNITMEEVIIEIDELEKCFAADVIINLKENSNYNLIEGRLPDGTKKEIALGKYYYEKLDCANNKYINIFGVQYEVVGEIATPKSDYQDYCIVLGRESIYGELNREINSIGSIKIVVGSNKMEVTKEVKELLNNLNEIEGLECSAESNVQNHVDNSNGLVLMYFGICFFCIISLIIISELVIKALIPEVNIRRAYGFENRQLEKLLFKEVGKIVCVSTFIGLFVQVLLKKIISKELNISIDFSARSILYIFIGALVLTVILTKNIMIKLKRSQIADFIIGE